MTNWEQWIGKSWEFHRVAFINYAVAFQVNWHKIVTRLWPTGLPVYLDIVWLTAKLTLLQPRGG
jgi:hypothetical protein